MEEKETQNAGEKIETAPAVDEFDDLEERGARRFFGGTHNVRRIRMILLFAIGIALGVVAKTEAAPRLTIGFQDYMVSPGGARYDLNEVARTVAQKQAQAEESDAPTDGAALPFGGAACGQ